MNRNHSNKRRAPHLVLVLLVSLSIIQATAQQVNTDSLWRVAETTKNDSLRLQAISRLHIHYGNLEIDSTVDYAKRLIKTCDKYKLPRYTALGILYSSYVFVRTGDYKKVQESITQAAAIAEKTQDEEILARVESFRNFIEPNLSKKMKHLRKAIQYKKAVTRFDPLSTIYLGNFSGTLLASNQVDSAFFYAQKMYESAIKTNDTISSYVSVTMGNIYLKLKQPEIAYAFYKKAIKAALTTQKIRDLMIAYGPMANYFNNTNQPDSALYYWKKPFELGPKEEYIAKLSASRRIYDYYLQKGNNDSAVKYMHFYIIANDSINNRNKVAQLQAAKFEDELRQREFEKEQEAARESRKHTIQLIITAFAIISFILLFLLLSRSILVSHQLVGFLSMVALLVVFEFINLLIHPWLERVTHHSPLLMLLGLVAIAALLVPLHHKLEHWTTKKLVEKNKAIRLANAKKTIAELENKEKHS